VDADQADWNEQLNGGGGGKSRVPIRAPRLAARGRSIIREIRENASEP